MNVNISQIVADKLAQLDADGVIKRKIEETVEKTVLDAVTSELSSYTFRSSISKQVQESVSKVAADCGFSAYNGFIAQTVKKLTQEVLSADITDKVQRALNDVILQRHENIRLSDIFKRYREWVLEHTDESDKYERQEYTGDLEIEEDGGFTKYICRFADHSLESGYLGSREQPEIEIRFWVYRGRKTSEISRLWLNNHDLGKSAHIGTLTAFEAFVANLYYNKTEIIMDPDDVDDDTSFDIDY